MANVRDSDTSLWLHNKLGTSNDSWTGGSICSQLNAEVLRNIKDCFPDLQTQVKLKLLLSFFHIPRRNVEEWHVELDEILEVAQVDSEQWVSMLAELMKTLPSTGSLNTNISEVDENRRIFSDLVNDLRKLVKKQSDLGMLPLECHYLNKSALFSVVGQQPPMTKHFTLKRKPKSAALRAELMQKSVDAASNLKKSTAPTVPVRSRGMPRKMTDTTPLKGIPSRVPTGGFRSPNLNSSLLSRPSLPRTPAGRKDGGIKLLDINEQPLGYAQAKKRKRMQEMEEAKRASEAAMGAATPTGSTASSSGSGTTPDYAVGLTALNPGTPAPLPIYTPTPSASVVNTTITTAPGTTTTTVTMTVQTNTGSTQTTEATASPAPATPALPVVQQPTTVAAQVIQTRQISAAQVTAKVNTQTANRPVLQLTREQMLEAQNMFRTSNKVTRPEKALILGFMAGSRVFGDAVAAVLSWPACHSRGAKYLSDFMVLGSREREVQYCHSDAVTVTGPRFAEKNLAQKNENPCPQLGNIVTIKLSENQESIRQQDDTYQTMLVETHFQMNYNTGEWKRILKYRDLDEAAQLAAAAAATQQQQQQQQTVTNL